MKKIIAETGKALGMLAALVGIVFLIFSAPYVHWGNWLNWGRLGWGIIIACIIVAVMFLIAFVLEHKHTVHQNYGKQP